MKRPQSRFTIGGGVRKSAESLRSNKCCLWNVRKSHDDTDFKLTSLLNEMKRLHIDILEVSETHWTNETTKAFQKEQHVIIHSRRTGHIHRQCVTIILKGKLAKQLVA